MDAAVWVENVSVTVGKGADQKTLLHNISLSVPEGTFLSIIGASGCGKSTLMRTIIGLQPASAGRILLAGHLRKPCARQLPLAVGYLPQFCAFHGELTVAEILDFAVSLRLPSSVPRSNREQWCEHVIDLARIRPFLHQKYRTLSGGQQRRIALAEELIGDPAILFLDQLTSGIDAESEHELMVWLKDLAHGMNKTVILVSHAVDNLGLCDSVVFLHEGRLASKGPTTNFSRPMTPIQSKPFLGAINWPPPRANSSGSTRTVRGIAAGTGPHALNTAPPPGSLRQLSTLIRRQIILLGRDRAQLWLHLALLMIFPALVAIFATNGLPEVGRLNMRIESDLLKTLEESLSYLKDSFAAASLVSGLTMFQVILLTLMGANNGAREIAKERDVLEKELRAGLSPWAYVLTKSLLVSGLSMAQAFWIDLVRQDRLRLPRRPPNQFQILFATALAMSMICLAISSISRSPERASLLAIYLVGLQLPLSGAVLAFPNLSAPSAAPSSPPTGAGAVTSKRSSIPSTTNRATINHDPDRRFQSLSPRAFPPHHNRRRHRLDLRGP